MLIFKDIHITFGYPSRLKGGRGERPGVKNTSELKNKQTDLV